MDSMNLLDTEHWRISYRRDAQVERLCQRLASLN